MFEIVWFQSAACRTVWRSVVLTQQVQIVKKSTFIGTEKKFLGVEMRTPNDFVYGETNRYPLLVNSSVRCKRYWLKLTRMNVCRLPGEAYRIGCYGN